MKKRLPPQEREWTRKILIRLIEKELTASKLSRIIGIGQSTIRGHLITLENEGFVRSEILPHYKSYNVTIKGIKLIKYIKRKEFFDEMLTEMSEELLK